MAAWAGFVEPMLFLRTEMLPDDAERWEYQLKFDGYRAVAFKTGGILHVRSRNDNDFTSRYPGSRTQTRARSLARPITTRAAFRDEALEPLGFDRTKTFDALIFGYYEGDRLLYAARTRNGFTPALC